MQFKARSMRSKGRVINLYAGKQRQENGTLRYPLETGRGVSSHSKPVAFSLPVLSLPILAFMSPITLLASLL